MDGSNFASSRAFSFELALRMTTNLAKSVSASLAEPQRVDTSVLACVSHCLHEKLAFCMSHVTPKNTQGRDESSPNF